MKPHITPLGFGSRECGLRPGNIHITMPVPEHIGPRSANAAARLSTLYMTLYVRISNPKSCWIMIVRVFVDTSLYG